MRCLAGAIKNESSDHPLMTSESVSLLLKELYERASKRTKTTRRSKIADMLNFSDDSSWYSEAEAAMDDKTP